jgi:CIC family chloride channel protein
MNVEQARPPQDPDEWRGLFALSCLALCAGALSGLVASLFRIALEHADRLRDAFVAWAHPQSFMGCALFVGACAACTAVAAWLVHRFAPYASGSGIPHVEAVLEGELPHARYRLIPIKFVGGFLAIGSGLALGREGPSVQMGASLSGLLGKLCGRDERDCRALLAAGAGAGLATAFNAPVAGAVFVLEELARRFDTRITVATFGASAGAITVARLIIGDAPDFHFAALPYAGFGTLPIYIALGVVAGLLGVAYNHALLGAMNAAESLRRCPVELRAACIGAAVGLLAWWAPDWVGGGDALTQRALSAADGFALVSMIFVLRFALGAVSYAAETPGGLFAPMLVIGSQSGLLFGILCADWFPSANQHPTALALVGMAAFFTAVVRAPVTGIILVTEMTASFTLLLPMLGACFAAMAVPELMRNPPIYASLRRKAAGKRASKAPEA